MSIKVTEKLNREPYKFKDINCGEFFYADETTNDVTGDYTFSKLFLKIKDNDELGFNAVRLDDSFKSGDVVKFKKDSIVEYVSAEIVIKERLKDHPQK